MTQVFIYNRALSADEVNSLYETNGVAGRVLSANIPPGYIACKHNSTINNTVDEMSDISGMGIPNFNVLNNTHINSSTKLEYDSNFVIASSSVKDNSYNYGVVNAFGKKYNETTPSVCSLVNNRPIGHKLMVGYPKTSL